MTQPPPAYLVWDHKTRTVFESDTLAAAAAYAARHRATIYFPQGTLDRDRSGDSSDAHKPDKPGD